MRPRRTLPLLCSALILGGAASPASAALAPDHCNVETLVPVAASSFGGTHSFSLRNVSPRACVVADHPHVSLRSGSHRLPVRLSAAASKPRAQQVPSQAVVSFTLTVSRPGCVVADRLRLTMQSEVVEFRDMRMSVCRGTEAQVSPYRTLVAH